MELSLPVPTAIIVGIYSRELKTRVRVKTCSSVHNRKTWEAAKAPFGV